MKKILLTLLAVSISLASCKNYDSNFAALNKTIADLQTQVAGFTSLQTGLTSLQTSVTSLSGTVATLQSSVNAIPTSQVDLSTLEGDLASALANIATLQSDLSGIVSDYATGTDLATTTANVAILQAALDAAQLDITAILASNNVYSGDLTITNAAELAFAQTLGAKVGIINGKVTVVVSAANGLSATAVNAITSQMLSVTGSVTVTTNAALDFSGLASVGSTTTVGVNVTANADVDMSALTTVGGSYVITNFDISDAALTTVGGNLVLNYDGGYVQPNLTTVGGFVTLYDKTTNATANPPVVGTLAVDFSGLTTISGGLVATNAPGTSGTVRFVSATSVKLNAGVDTVTADKAATVDLLAPNYAGLDVSAGLAGSVITISGTVNNAATTPAGLALRVTGSATSVVNAANVSELTTLDVITIATAVSFPALTTATVVNAAAVIGFNAPLMVASTSVSVAAAKDLSIASTPTLNAAVLENVTFSALASAYTAVASLKTAAVTGKVGATNSFTSTSAVLASASFAGELDAVSLTVASALTSLTTAGAIDTFTLDNATILTAATFGHDHIVGGPGSVMTITNNPVLAALTTGTDYLKTLTVFGNSKLATMDFSSYTNILLTGIPNVSIHNNALKGTWTVPAAATSTSAFVEATITQASLATFSTYVAAMHTSAVGTGGLSNLSLNINISDVDPSATITSLSTALTADLVANNASYTQAPSIGTAKTALVADVNGNATLNDNNVADSFTKLDSAAEFALIQ